MHIFRYLQTVAAYTCLRLGLDVYDESGQASTEYAVMVAAAVAIAAALGGVIYAVAQDNADQIAVPSPPGS